MDDATLVADSLRGDLAAFGQIVERYQAMACAVAYSIVGELSASEDVAQEAFVAAWQHLSSLREPAKLRAWLAAVVRNTAKSSARKRQHDVVQNAEPIVAVATNVATPDDQAADSEEEALLGRALADVPEQFREPLVLYYREHQSIAEVALTMQLTEDAVKQRLARGRQALKRQVATYVETALRRTGPKAAFTAGVLAAINSTAGTASAAAAAGATATTAGTLITGSALGIAGGVGGSLIGLGGAAFGTACSIRNARSPAERALMVKAAWFGWVYCSAFVALFLYVAFYQRPWFESIWFQASYWTIHATVMGISITWLNKKARKLQLENPPGSTL